MDKSNIDLKFKKIYFLLYETVDIKPLKTWDIVTGSHFVNIWFIFYFWFIDNGNSEYVVKCVIEKWSMFYSLRK